METNIKYDFKKILYDLQVCKFLHEDLSEIIHDFARLCNKHTYWINIYYKSINKELKEHVCRPILPSNIYTCKELEKRSRRK